MQIIAGGLDRVEVAELLQQHLDEMAQHSPAESIHALDLAALRTPDISFFSAWNGNELMGCGALKSLGAHQGELKSMRTATAFLRQGVAAMLLTHLIETAQRRHYKSLWLETGSMAAFKPARQLYAKYGFIECEPFGDYSLDPNSIFMTLALSTS